MKGFIFIGFLDLVEETFGLESVEEIITQSELPSKGIYTSVGTYQFSEMLSLITNLSRNTNISVDRLLHVYGLYFFKIIKRDYPQILDSYDNAIDLLSSVESHIHVEVQKIYPDAELPRFEVTVKDDDTLILTCFSSRSMYAFGLGLMEKALEYYKQDATITYEKIKEDGSVVKFVISKNG